jgi:chromatin remodeling complex protein RSC6
MTESNQKIPANVKKMEAAIQSMESAIQSQKTALHQMEKEFSHFKRLAISFIENAKKSSEKKPRKPSGFMLPVPISPELCRFLNIPEGSQASRTEVTKYLIDYIDEHQLIDPERKTIVVPDDALSALLGPDVDAETLTRFTIQKYMNRHFTPITAPTTAKGV